MRVEVAQRGDALVQLAGLRPLARRQGDAGVLELLQHRLQQLALDIVGRLHAARGAVQLRVLAQAGDPSPELREALVPCTPTGPDDAVCFRDFLTHVFPTSVVSAMAGNEVLQILVFSIFFGFAIASWRRCSATWPRPPRKLSTTSECPEPVETGSASVSVMSELVDGLSTSVLTALTTCKKVLSSVM